MDDWKLSKVSFESVFFCSFFIKSDKHKIFSRTYTEEGIDEGVAASAAHGEPVTAEE